VFPDLQSIEIVPMCVSGSFYSITLDGIVLDTSIGITQIENVNIGSHTVCMHSYESKGVMLNTLCMNVLVCPPLFAQYGEMCLYYEEYGHDNQTSSEAKCADLSSTLPYPTGDFINWHTVIYEAIEGNRGMNLPYLDVNNIENSIS
ncbi:unnamed protein product, partial [Meganyctiphanes norvegica]